MPDRPTETAVAGRPAIDVEDLHALVLKSLDDDQAVEVVTIPLAGKSNIADHMVIASGRSTRQVASMANKLFFSGCWPLRFSPYMRRLRRTCRALSSSFGRSSVRSPAT